LYTDTDTDTDTDTGTSDDNIVLGRAGSETFPGS